MVYTSRHKYIYGNGAGQYTGIWDVKVAELKEGLLQLSLDTSGLKAELVRQLTEARTAREGAEQEPQ